MGFGVEIEAPGFPPLPKNPVVLFTTRRNRVEREVRRRQQNLPQALIDFIEQHHGTTLVEYFYHEATRQAGQRPDHKTDAEEASFRYPGPKPQSREAGVLMLADAIESASRTLSEPTPKRIERLVHEVTLKRLLDGQFDECSLTLSEIHAIEDSLNKSLIAIYHGRIKYPEQQTA